MKSRRNVVTCPFVVVLQARFIVAYSSSGICAACEAAAYFRAQFKSSARFGAIKRAAKARALLYYHCRAEQEAAVCEAYSQLSNARVDIRRQ